MIVLKIANLQALAKQPATSSIGQNYTPADSRTPLLALRTCPPSSFWGFLEINFFWIFPLDHAEIRAKVIPAQESSPLRNVSSAISTPTLFPRPQNKVHCWLWQGKAAVITCHSKRQASLCATNNFLCDCRCKSDWSPERSFWILLQRGLPDGGLCRCSTQIAILFYGRCKSILQAYGLINKCANVSHRDTNGKNACSYTCSCKSVFYIPQVEVCANECRATSW